MMAGKSDGDQALRNARVLVTGASGFTGSRLTAELLEAGASVTALTFGADPQGAFLRMNFLERLTRIPGSIVDFELLKRTIADQGIDTVFHLAGISIESTAYERPLEAFEANIRGTYNVLEACRVNSSLVSRVIVASSDKAYGDCQELPYKEKFPVEGRNPYDVSKSCGDLLARSYHHSYGLPVAVARFANIYGGGDLNWTRLVPGTIRRLLNQEPPLVRSPPHGEYKRDFLYIEDQVRAYLSLLAGLSRPEVQGQAFNFGMGACISVPEIVAQIQEIMGLEHIVPVRQNGDHSEIPHQQLSIDRAEKELGWCPRSSFEEGLTETVKWYTRFLQYTA
jgi:CDP-glucose 4,6-dehydratase